MNQHAEYSSLSSIAFKTNLRLFCLIIVLSHTLFVSSPLLTVIAAADVDDSSFSSSSTLLRHNNIDESTVGRDLGPILNDEKTVSVSSSYSMLTASWSTQRVRTLIASMFNDGKVTSTSINSLSSQPQHYDDNVDQKLITKQSVVQSSTHSLTSQSSSQPASNHQRNALAIEQASSSTNVENVETNNNSNDFVKRLNVKKTKSPTSTPTIRKPSRSPNVIAPTRNPRVRTPRPTDAPRTRKPTTKKPTSAPTKSPTKRKPNVVLIVADDIGYADVGFNKNPYVNTPYLNKLATESVRLNNFHMNPTCSPGRAGLFAGRYASRTGVWHTIMNRSILRSNETTLADVFKREGYNTALIGKWHLGDNYPYRPLDRGFDYWFGFYGGGLQQTPDRWDNTNNNPIFTRNQVEVVQTKGFCTDVLFDDAIAYLYKVKQPFLLVITPNAAHDPQTAPMEYKAQYKDQPYADFYGMINNLDVNIQKLDMALDSLGYKDYTIFIFTSDNGSACGSSRCTYNAGLSGDKSSVYDGGHRVPFIIRFPFDKSIIPHDVDELVAGIDILPMLIELTTLPVSTEYLTVSQFQESGTMYQYSKFKEENVGWEMMQLTKQLRFDGKSFVSLLRSVPDNGNFANRMVLVEDQREYTPVKWAATVIMMGDWRYIPPKLFDMKTDRAQTTNVAAKYPEIVQQMVDFYENYWNEVSPSFNLVERISVGNPIANPVYLNSMDWNTKIQPPWSQEMVTSEEGARFGAWTLKVEEAGMYKIVARRWPFDLERAINFSDSFKFARLVLDGSTVQTVPISGSKSSVEFKISLKQGPVDMMVVFYTSSSNSLGAYYTSVESL